MEGLVAIVLLPRRRPLGLQTAAVATGLPFALVLLVMCWSLKKAFDEELDLLEAHYDEAIYSIPPPGAPGKSRRRKPGGMTMVTRQGPATRRHLTKLVALLAASMLIVSACGIGDEEEGPVQIARADWSSGHMQAAIYAQLISEPRLRGG